MNADYFSITGWISVLVWLIVPLIWLFYSIKGPCRWLCPIALALALIALFLAKDNSKNYVNLIQPDRSAEMAAEEARKEASLKAFKESRGKDLSDVRFAEDGSDDTLDRAGMDSDDLKYLDKQTDSSEPDWKKDKKSRTEGGVDDGSVESALGGESAIEATSSETLDAMEEKVPVIMLEKDLAMANRLDTINLKIIYYLIGFGIFMVVIDYLKRANMHDKASYPIPLPSAWINSMSPLPTIVEHRGPINLASLAKRGDSFVYLTDDKEAAAKIPDSLQRWPIFKKHTEVLRADGEIGKIDNDFIFEAVWYGRGSFVVDSKARSEELIERFIELLSKRKQSRALVRQTVHLVWDMKHSLPDAQLQQLTILAKATGFSIVLCKDLAA